MRKGRRKVANDKYCNGCIYKGVVENHLPCCNYIFMEDKRRPCPPGKGCTVKVEGNYKATVEERRSQAAERQREHRAKVRAANMRTIKCDICGAEFKSADTRRRYCSKECGHIAHIQQTREYWKKHGDKYGKK